MTDKVIDSITRKAEEEFEEADDLEQGFHLFTLDDIAERFPDLDAKVDEELRNWEYEYLTKPLTQTASKNHLNSDLSTTKNKPQYSINPQNQPQVSPPTQLHYEQQPP